MTDLDLINPLLVKNSSKIVLLVMDGLGGVAREPGGKTELESANRPNLNALAARSALGLADPVAPGITPGSGPGHLGLFGYDPLEYVIGRGVLEALGIDFPLGPDDVAARGNFCSVDAAGNITDRRAGRISTELNQALVAKLSQIRVPGVECFVETVKEHRFVLVLRGPNLRAEMEDTDPERLGVPPLPVRVTDPAAQSTAELVERWIAQAREVLKNEHPANMVLLRGFARRPTWPTFKQAFGLRAASIAVYPMYRGVAKLVGMQAVPVQGETVADEFAALEQYWNDYDFFYVHVKKTDSYGEDGAFDKKVHVIEEVDAHLPRLMALRPDVVLIGGDHSTPAVLKAHSWHPVPILLYARSVRADNLAEYGESACARGSLGRLRSKELMPLALANALRMTKYGA